MVKLVNMKWLSPDWVTDSQYQYIGRAGEGFNGYFGNPVVKYTICPICGTTHKTGGSTLPCYEVYLRTRLEGDAEFRDAVKNLKDKTLVCFCSDPKRCHGSILKKYIENLNEIDLDW